MPSLIVQQANAAVRRHPLKVFVSYAHEDARFAKTFIGYLKLLWEGLRFDEKNLFYDAERLSAGYVWEEALFQALEDLDVMILLVSARALHRDHYCMDVEIAAAARANAVIVPIVLTQCPWQDVRIPGAPAERTFGALGALPLTVDRKVKPVTHWKRSDQAWHAVIEGLRDVLTAIGTSADRVPAVASANPGVTPMAIEPDFLPYLCDQTRATGAFDRGLAGWETRALVVLIKGVYDDNTARFWERLRLEHLSQFVALDPGRGRLLGPDNPFMLPVDDTRSRVADLKRALFYELSMVLTGNRYRLTNARELTNHLRSVPGAISLFAMPAVGSEQALQRAIEALLEIFDEIDRDDVRRRIVVAVNLEGTAILDRRLAIEWNFTRFTSSLLLELDPLLMVNWDDARLWYVQRRIKDHFRVDERRLAAIFHHDTAMRMRTFEERLRPLLKVR
jgi:hypothetical protein